MFSIQFQPQGALMMKAVRTSETSVYFYESSRCRIPEGSHLVLARVRAWNISSSCAFLTQPVLQQDVSSRLLVDFALDYVIRKGIEKEG
jgi:hypothetical protein